LGLGTPSRVVPLLLVAEGTTNRDRIQRLAPLFARFAVRGRAAISCLRRSNGSGGAALARGLLIFTELRYATGGSVTRVAPHRTRLPRNETSMEQVRIRAATGAGGT
jgi:hypothetical protein